MIKNDLKFIKCFAATSKAGFYSPCALNAALEVTAAYECVK